MTEALERFVPSLNGAIAHEHYHRYIMAMHYVAGKTVLDVASGEGYGAALLARKARQIVGVDIDAKTVAHAQRWYGKAGRVEFLVGDCSALPCPDSSFDVVVSFETIEHIVDQAAFLRQVRRVLVPGGLLIISTPNKPVYLSETGLTNEFHLKELDETEFRNVLHTEFDHVCMFGQRFVMPSLIWPIDVGDRSACRELALSLDKQGALDSTADMSFEKPSYLIAICSDTPIAIGPRAAIHVDLADDLWLEHMRIIRWASSVHDRTEALQATLREREAIISAHETQDNDEKKSRSALEASFVDAVAASNEERIRLLAAIEGLQASLRHAEGQVRRRDVDIDLARAEHTTLQDELRNVQAESLRQAAALAATLEACRSEQAQAELLQTRLTNEISGLRAAISEKDEAIQRASMAAVAHEQALRANAAGQAEAVLQRQHLEAETVLLRQSLSNTEEGLRQAIAQASDAKRALQNERQAMLAARRANDALTETARVNIDALAEIKASAHVVDVRRGVLNVLTNAAARVRQHPVTSANALTVVRAQLRVSTPLGQHRRRLSWIERRRFERDMIFDAAFYLSQNPDVAAAGVDPLAHYLSHGLFEDRDPNPRFSAAWYRLKAPEPVGDMPAYAHHLADPVRKGWAAHPLFDAGYYVAKHRDIGLSELDAYQHFLASGALERRDPHPLVDLAHLVAHADLAQSANPLFDYLCRSELHRASPHPLFDGAGYLAENRDVANAGTNPLLHYVVAGWRQGRAPHPLFAADWYLATNPDVLNAAVEPLTHYVSAGAQEGRNPHPLFDVDFFLGTSHDASTGRRGALVHYAEGGWRSYPETTRSISVSDMRRWTPDTEWGLADPISTFLKHGPESVSIPSHYVEVAPIVGRPLEAWPPIPRPTYTLPAGLKNFIADRYGKQAIALYTYLMATVTRYGDEPEAFGKSGEAAALRARMETLCTPHETEGDVDVSIVIPVYNNLVFTLTSVLSILEGQSRRSYEIIIADDGSADETPDVFAAMRGAVRLSRNPVNLGFLGNCNAGAKIARGRYLVMLNNDTLVLPDWLDELIDPFERYPSIGLTGSKLLNADGTLQEAGGIFWNDGSAWNFGRNADPRRPEFNYLKDVDYVSGASIALPMDLWRTLDGFDPIFTPAYCEDSDIAFRVRRQGRRTVYAPHSALVHHEGKSHGRDTSSGIKAYQIANNKKLLKRWGETLKIENFPNGENVFLARDRSRTKPHLLVVDHYIPQWDRDAGSRTMHHFIRMFVENGFQVTLWPDNLYEDVEYCRALQNMGVEVIYSSAYVDRFPQYMAENGRYFNYALLSRPHIAIGYYDAVRAHSKARILYYGHDVHHRRMQLEYQTHPSKELALAITQMRAQECANWARSDVVLYPSDEEREVVLADSPDVTAARVPMLGYVDTEFEAGLRNIAAFEARDVDQLVFVGGSHPPNVDALIWFTHEVFPLIIAERPSTRLNVVGASVHEDVRKLASDSLVIRGRLSDTELDELYATAGIALIPLRFGGGVKGKTIEALFKGIPLVATSVGMQGLEAGQPIGFVADTARNFADAVLRAQTDRAEALKRVKAGFTFVQDQYSIGALADAFAPFVAELADRSTRRTRTSAGNPQAFAGKPGSSVRKGRKP